MAIALDPRCKMFYGFPENEHNDVWGAVTQAAGDITMTQDQQHQQEDETWVRQTTSPSTDSTPRSIHDQQGERLEAARLSLISKPVL